MTEPVYRAAPPETLRVVRLDEFVAIYHRPSGITHLITAPAPEILAELGKGGLTLPELAEALLAQYAISDFNSAAMEARLEELVAAGLATTE